MDRAALRKRLLQKTNEQIEENLSETEVHIIKSVKLLADLQEIQNLMQENAADWKVRHPTEKAQELLAQLQTNIKQIDDEKKELVLFIEEKMKTEMPSTSSVTGPLLAGKLLAEAGSKRKLAFMPSSTIQVLGAKKALFNHLKHRGKCPKHGLIFNHPFMQKLPKNKRGKAARIIAGKLSIAAKLDFFGKPLDESIAKQVEERISKL